MKTEYYLLLLCLSLLLLGVSGTAMCRDTGYWCELSSGEWIREAGWLQVRFTSQATLEVTDLRTGQVWRQARVGTALEVLDIFAEDDTLYASLQDAGGAEYRLSLTPMADTSEILCEVAGEGRLSELAYPYPFLPDPKADFIQTLKEGLAIPVTDSTIYFQNNSRRRYAFFEGHNGAMPFWGFANPDGSGLMTLVETPNDAEYRLYREDGLLTAGVIWCGTFAEFGYPRRIRYVFFEEGGYVAMAKRYRQAAQEEGLLVTLVKKAEVNPHVDLLIGAANLWVQDTLHLAKPIETIIQELKALGVERAIFNFWEDQPPSSLAVANALGYLSSRYDAYADSMDPAKYPSLGWINPCWVSEAWPAQLNLDPTGRIRDGWPVTDRTGQTVYCGIVSEQVRLDYARNRVAQDLATKPYLARYIDVEGAKVWLENYNPDYLASRTDVRHYRMALLAYMSQEIGFVTGTEGLQAFAVPYVHYFEGVAPIEPFTADMPPTANTFDTFPADYEFPPANDELLSVAHRYQIPLWQLVFHDCVVSYPRWNTGPMNKFANDTWLDLQVLSSALNGRPPIFVGYAEYWEDPCNLEFVAELYRRVGPLSRLVGYAEMVDHQYLLPNRDVQQTTFDNGIVVIVNFGTEAFVTAEGLVVPPKDFLVLGAPLETTGPSIEEDYLLEVRPGYNLLVWTPQGDGLFSGGSIGTLTLSGLGGVIQSTLQQSHGLVGKTADGKALADSATVTATVYEDNRLLVRGILTLAGDPDRSIEYERLYVFHDFSIDVEVVVRSEESLVFGELVEVIPYHRDYLLAWEDSLVALGDGSRRLEIGTPENRLACDTRQGVVKIPLTKSPGGGGEYRTSYHLMVRESSVKAPQAGAVMAGTVALEIALPPYLLPLKHVQVLLDDRVLHEGPEVPGKLMLNTAELGDGEHILCVTGESVAGVRQEDAVAFSVQNLQLEVSGWPLVHGETTLKISTVLSPAEMRTATIRLEQMAGERIVDAWELYHGETLPTELVLDTYQFADGDYIVSVVAETVYGTTCEASKTVLFGNWRYMTDEFKPPTKGLFGLMDHSQTIDASAGWTYGTEEAADFFQDAGRRVRVQDSTEHLTWKTQWLHAFTLTLYARDASLEGTLRLEGSPDQVTWYELPYDVVVKDQSPAGWLLVDVAGKVAGEVHYFRLTLLPGTGAADAIQLGQIQFEMYREAPAIKENLLWQVDFREGFPQGWSFSDYCRIYETAAGRILLCDNIDGLTAFETDYHGKVFALEFRVQIERSGEWRPVFRYPCRTWLIPTGSTMCPSGGTAFLSRKVPTQVS